MFRIFETSIDFNVLSAPTNYWFKHLTGNEKGLRICPFGQIVVLPIIVILILRAIISIPTYIINTLIVLSVLISFINLNAFIYLIPIWITEIIIKYNYETF